MHNACGARGTFGVVFFAARKRYAGHAADSFGDEWYWAAVMLQSDYAFHCPTRYAGRIFSQPSPNKNNSSGPCDRRAGADGTCVGGGEAVEEGVPTPLWLYSFNMTDGRTGCVSHCSELAGITLGTCIHAANISVLLAPVHEYLRALLRPSMRHYREFNVIFEEQTKNRELAKVRRVQLCTNHIFSFSNLR